MITTSPLVYCPFCGDRRVEAEIVETSNERINAECFYCKSRWQIDIIPVNYKVLEDNSDRIPANFLVRPGNESLE